MVYFIESSPKDQLQPKLHSNSYLKPGDQIAQTKPHLFDIAGKKEVPLDETLFGNPWSISSYRRIVGRATPADSRSTTTKEDTAR